MYFVGSMEKKVEKTYSGGKLVKIKITAGTKPEDVQKAEEKQGLEFEVGMSREDAITVFTKIPTITKKKAISLYDSGIKSLRQLALASTETLLAIKDITLENAKAIKVELKDLVAELEQKTEITEPKPSVAGGVKTVGGKIVSVGKGAFRTAKKGTIVLKGKITSAYKKISSPREEEPKPETKETPEKKPRKGKKSSAKKIKKVVRKRKKASSG